MRARPRSPTQQSRVSAEKVEARQRGLTLVANSLTVPASLVAYTRSSTSPLALSRASARSGAGTTYDSARAAASALVSLSPADEPRPVAWSYACGAVVVAAVGSVTLTWGQRPIRASAEATR